MDARIQVVAIGAAAALILVLLDLVRRRRPVSYTHLTLPTN